MNTSAPTKTHRNTVRLQTIHIQLFNSCTHRHTDRHLLEAGAIFGYNHLDIILITNQTYKIYNIKYPHKVLWDSVLAKYVNKLHIIWHDAAFMTLLLVKSKAVLILLPSEYSKKLSVFALVFITLTVSY